MQPSLSRFCVFFLLLLALPAPALAQQTSDLHQQLLNVAERQQAGRRARFAAVRTRADLETLQRSLREKFLHAIGGLPRRAGVPPAKVLGRIQAEDYLVEKLVLESFPGYFVPAL